MSVRGDSSLQWQLSWHDGGEVLVIECSGVLSTPGVIALVDAITANPRIVPVRACITDVRAVDFSQMDAATMRALAAGRAGAPLASSREGRVAIVVSSRRAYGLAKMYAALSAAVRAPGRFEVFRDVDEALGWAGVALELSRAGAPPATGW